MRATTVLLALCALGGAHCNQIIGNEKGVLGTGGASEGGGGAALGGGGEEPSDTEIDPAAPAPSR